MAKKRKKKKQVEEKSNNNLIYLAVGVIFLIAIALFFISYSNSSSETKIPDSIKDKVTLLPNKADTSEPGIVKMTEFMKFNCGHCYKMSKELPKLKQKYGDKLKIAYVPMLWRSVPTDKGYEKAIEAYIIASEKGKAKEMEDALFKAQFEENKDITSITTLSEIGRSIGLGDDFVNQLKNDSKIDKANENIRIAESYQVFETPTFVINGNLKVNNPTIENLDYIVGELLNNS